MGRQHNMEKRKGKLQKKSCCTLFIIVVLLSLMAVVLPLSTGILLSESRIQQPSNLRINDLIKTRPTPFDQEAWHVNLTVQETLKGKMDLVVFGEAQNANDSLPVDPFDVPDPGLPPPAPYINAWFDAGLPGVYKHLMKDYKHYPGTTTNKVWNLSILCDLTGPTMDTTDIILSWYNEEIAATEYEYVELYYGGVIVADMFTVNQYTLEDATAYTKYYFDIKCRMNAAPVVNAGNDATVNEGSSFYQDGSFTDEGSYAWTANVSYGDGTPVQDLLLKPDKSFTLDHVYGDDGVYTVTVQVKDDRGTVGTDTLLVTVENVAPTATLGNDGPKGEGSVVTVSFSAQFDPGTSDTFTYSFDWDNDDVYEIVGQGSASAVHTWYDEGTFTVQARITDNDGGFSEYTTDVVVTNVAPIVDTGPDKTINQGATFTSSGYFIDPGADQWAATVDYGDGSGIQFLLLNSDKTFSLSHAYSNYGEYTVTVIVQDYDFGQGSDTAVVTVLQYHQINIQYGWNLISLPVYEEIAKADITVSANGNVYPWAQAVSDGIVMDTIYNWTQGTGPYGTPNSLVPGDGYWLWAYNYNQMFLLISSNAPSPSSKHITDLKSGWNLIGLPYETPLDQNNMTVNKDGTNYSWSYAVGNNIILGFIYGWNNINQVYTLQTSLAPEKGYWMYAYFNVTLYRGD